MIRHLSIRLKINLIIAVIFLVVITVATGLSLQREREYILQIAKEQVTDLSTWYFDSLNTMMLTGTMNERSILREKLLARSQVLEARVVRGTPVSGQFGPGLPEENPVDELDRKALSGEAAIIVKNGPKGRELTVLTPFRATENTRGVNCLRCHKVPSGSINGAIRVSYSLAHMDGNTTNEMMRNITTNIVLFAIGLILVNLLLQRWLINPLNRLMSVVNRRAQGDTSARADLIANDELGRLAHAFDNMADNISAIAEREHATAENLQKKVDALLMVMNKVTEGDFNTKIPFSGDDAIGELASSLQIMIDYIRLSIDEKKEAVTALQNKVDKLLTVVKTIADGDLTRTIELNGDDAIGQMGQGVQTMTTSLNELVRQIRSFGLQVNASANEITGGMKQVETTAEQQAVTANDIAVTATEISATTKELVRTMDEVADVAEKATRAAMQSHAGLSRMETLMRQVVQASGVVEDKLEILHEKAENISEVVTTITRVADQTNLLSLNAAIEAEKAGEYGRGFAVVASEIRRLADQAAVATLDIDQMIKEMQDAVHTGVQSMGKFNEQLTASVDEVQSVSREQIEIIEHVETLGPRFESVHQSMHFQLKGAEQINEDILNLSNSSQRTVQILKQFGVAIANLSGATQGLTNSISRFKVTQVNK